MPAVDDLRDIASVLRRLLDGDLVIGHGFDTEVVVAALQQTARLLEAAEGCHCWRCVRRRRERGAASTPATVP